MNGIEKAKGMLESLFYTDSGALKPRFFKLVLYILQNSTFQPLCVTWC